MIRAWSRVKSMSVTGVSGYMMATMSSGRRLFCAHSLSGCRTASELPSRV